jgi:hypothetical protein
VVELYQQGRFYPELWQARTRLTELANEEP